MNIQNKHNNSQFSVEYLPHTTSATACSHDFAQGAYLNAVTYLKKELQDDYNFEKLIKGGTNVEDIKRVVEKAKERYDSESTKTSARKWLRIFSTRILYYGKILDTIAQHHPEYVALAWGSIKFVLVGILNHANLVTQFSKALAKIGDALSQARLSAELYQTDLMKEAVSHLYAHIILFFQKSVKWYNMSSAGRALSSIFKPFELEYEDTILEINLCAQNVNDIASAASRAELRQVYNVQQKELEARDERLREMQEQLEARDERLREMQKQLKDIQEKTCMFLQIATTITENIQVEVLQINPRLHDLQFSNIIQTLQPKQSPEEIFEKAQSLSKRIRTLGKPPRDTKILIECLGKWLSGEGSSLFLVKVGLRAEARAKEFSTEIIKLLRPRPYGVIWNLSWLRSNGNVPSLVEMIKSLIYQALRHDPTLLQKYPEDLNVAKYQTNLIESEWISLLSRLMSRLTKCFLVIEAEDIFNIHRENTEWPSRFLGLFQELVDQAASSGNLLKILVIGHGTTLSTSQSVPDSNNRIIATIQRPIPVPPHMSRRMGVGRKHTTGWQHLKPKF